MYDEFVLYFLKSFHLASEPLSSWNKAVTTQGQNFRSLTHLMYLTMHTSAGRSLHLGALKYAWMPL